MKKLFLLVFVMVFLAGCSTFLKSDSEILTSDKSADQMADEIERQIDNTLNQEDADQTADEIGKQIENTLNQKDADQAADKIEKQMNDVLAREETDKQTKIMKSCNSISKTSTCIDYVGSFWSEEQKKYHCQESGVLSDKVCENGNIGGCQIGRGSPSDIIIWMYPYGGEPISADTVQSAKPGCDMNPMGNWLNAR